ncbi:hypothetical protein BDZ89DRAFT_947843 [Hymenopellis radicata]|nr:hypothetical protein BDZ89DRAFT_947843 [Hymenopellis radicata]
MACSRILEHPLLAWVFSWRLALSFSSSDNLEIHCTSLARFFYIPETDFVFIQGHKRANALLQQWVQTDRVQYGQNTPDWKIRIPGIYNNRAVLTIMLPFSLTTVFHPDAYLPAYINAPNDVDAVYYYPFKGQAQAGLPRMSVVGNVPLYADEKRGFADYKV